MMKYLVKTFFAVLFFFNSTAQQYGANYFDAILPNFIYTLQIEEFGNSIYVLEVKTGSKAITTGVYPRAYTLNKIDKISGNLIADKLVMGDTTSTTSQVNFSGLNFCITDDGRLLLGYMKFHLVDSSLIYYNRYSSEIFFQSLDTNLQVVTPETSLSFFSNSVSYKTSAVTKVIPITNNHIAILYNRVQLAVSNERLYTEYVIINNDGSIVKTDTLGSFSFFNTSSNFVSNVLDQVKIGNNFLFTGVQLFDDINWYQIIETDTFLNLMDTFRVKPNTFQVPPYNGQFSWTPEVEVLPGGNSIILAGSYSTPRKNLSGSTSMVAKADKQTRWTSHTFRQTGFKDTNDVMHDQYGFYKRLLSYNDFDKRIYRLEATHVDEVSRCVLDHNYLMLTCLDTNLNVYWQKFMKSGNDTCLNVNQAVKVYQRSGVVISFRHTTPIGSVPYTWKPYAYYIDSSGAALLGIGKDAPTIELRDRIALYPNPATTQITIDDVYNKIQSVQVYNASGQNLGIFMAKNGKVVIFTTSFSPGLYLAKVVTFDGFSKTLRLQKE